MLFFIFFPYVTITNKTPHRMDALVSYNLNFCGVDNIDEGIASGDAWTPSLRGCLVQTIYAGINDKHRTLTCKKYHSSGIYTSYSQFSIIMDGKNACCVLNNHIQAPQKC